MNIVGIICEYNPIHNGHLRHMASTRGAVGGDAAIVCVMSGNFVQRGDLAVFEKHVRAQAAVLCGADLVLELPLPYALSSAERFARGGVALLDALGVVTHLSFGSEAGEIAPLLELAEGLLAPETAALLRDEMKSGISYPAACHKAARRLMGDRADLLSTPNNVLGIEYLKALIELGSAITPVTVRRTGTQHDGPGPESASHLRRLFKGSQQPWRLIPAPAAALYQDAVKNGRGPVFIENAEQAVLSRLRMLPRPAWADLPDATEGIQDRLMRYAGTEPTLSAVLEAAKTKRYPLSRLRRMALCAALGLTDGDSRQMPPYARVLAMNRRGAEILRQIKAASGLPVITKPAQAKLLPGPARALFQKESDATDFYVLAYPGASNRAGGQEWTISPRLV